MKRTAAYVAAVAAIGVAAAAGAQAATGYKVLDRIPGPDGGWDYVTVDGAHNRVLVTRGSFVMAVDLATKAVTKFATGQGLHKALPVNGGSEVLLTNGGTDQAVFVDAKTGAQTAVVATGKRPDGATLDVRAGIALVMDHAGGDITLVDTKAHKAVGTIAVGGDLEEGAVDGAGHGWVNVENKSEVAAFDLKTQKVTARYALKGCEGPTGLTYDAQDKDLIVACQGATLVLDAKTGQPVATLATGQGADGVSYDPKQRLAFVPAARDGTLAVIAFGHGKPTVVDTVTTERGARTIGLDERTGRVYLPSATYTVPAGGGRPTVQPGSFHLLVVGK